MSEVDRRGFLGLLSAVGLAPEALKNIVVENSSKTIGNTVGSGASGLIKSMSGREKNRFNLRNLIRTSREQNGAYEFDDSFIHDQAERMLIAQYPGLYEKTFDKYKDGDIDSMKSFSSSVKSHYNRQKILEASEKFERMKIRKMVEILTRNVKNVPFLNFDNHSAYNIINCYYCIRSRRPDIFDEVVAGNKTLQFISDLRYMDDDVYDDNKESNKWKIS